MLCDSLITPWLHSERIYAVRLTHNSLVALRLDLQQAADPLHTAQLHLHVCQVTHHPVEVIGHLQVSTVTYHMLTPPHMTTIKIPGIFEWIMRSCISLLSYHHIANDFK